MPVASLFTGVKLQILVVAVDRVNDRIVVSRHVTEIRIEPKPFDGFWMKTAYRLPTGAFPGARFASQETPETTPITEILINSMVTSHEDGARLTRGRPAELAGWAWDGGSGIKGVEVSMDGGRSWRPAVMARCFVPSSIGRY